MATDTAYQQITDRVIALLEQGTRPWARAWKAGGGRPLRHNGEPYRGINTLNLWAAAEVRGFCSPYWMTYKTAESLGAQVTRGAKAERAFYVGTSSREVEQEDGSTSEDSFRFVKSYSVFNAQEIDGLARHFYEPSVAVPLAEGERHPRADAWIAGMGATIRHEGLEAHYVYRLDWIRVPEFRFFASGAAYYSVIFHELRARLESVAGLRCPHDDLRREESPDRGHHDPSGSVKPTNTAWRRRGDGHRRRTLATKRAPL